MTKILTLGGIILFSLSNTNMSGANLSTRGLERQGVALIGSTDPSFQTRLQAFGTGTVISLAQPSSVILVNNTKLGIAGCAVSWTIVNSDGKTQTKDSYLLSLPALNFPRVYGDSTAESVVPAGGSHFISPFFDVSPGQSPPDQLTSSSVSSLMSPYTSSALVTITLDAVLLEDGTFLGPDQLGYSKLVQAQLLGERQLKQQIIKRRNAGMTTDQIFESVQSEASNNNLPPDRMTGTPQNWQAYFLSQLARQLVRVRRVAGDNVFNEVRSNLFQHVPTISKVPYTGE